MSAYVSSGRFRADISKEAALSYRQSAHRYFRWQMPGEAKHFMRLALREWRMFRHFHGRIVQ